MTYLDRDPIVKALKEKDLYVKKNYLGKGGIKSTHLVRFPFSEAECQANSTFRWTRPRSS